MQYGVHFFQFLMKSNDYYVAGRSPEPNFYIRHNKLHLVKKNKNSRKRYNFISHESLKIKLLALLTVSITRLSRISAVRFLFWFLVCFPGDGDVI